MVEGSWRYADIAAALDLLPFASTVGAGNCWKTGLAGRLETRLAGKLCTLL